MSDAMEGLRAAAEDGNARRRQTRMVVIALVVLMTVNLASVLGIGVLFLHDRQRQSRERRNAAAGSKIVTDLYSVVNDTNAAVHRIEGTPAPAPAVPPAAATTTTSRSGARSAGRTASTAPPGTNRPSTTEIGQPPPSEPPQPPKPPPSPSTTTTTRRPVCVPATVPIVRC